MPIATRTICCLVLLSETLCIVNSFNALLYGSRQRRRPVIDSDARSRIIVSRFGLASNGENERKDDTAVDIVAVEKQVLAAAQAQMDANLILKALDVDAGPRSENLLQEDYATTRPFFSSTPSSWTIALAASLLCSGAVLVLSTYNLLLTSIVGLVVFVIALADPVEDDSFAGAFARTVGRLTIRSVEASQPKVKAVARAVVTGQDELVRLKKRINELENENADLKKWKDRRTKADECLGDFSLTILKEQARAHNLPVGGTKMQLLMRLVDAGVVDL